MGVPLQQYDERVHQQVSRIRRTAARVEIANQVGAHLTHCTFGAHVGRHRARGARRGAGGREGRPDAAGPGRGVGGLPFSADQVEFSIEYPPGHPSSCKARVWGATRRLPGQPANPFGCASRSGEGRRKSTTCWPRMWSCWWTGSLAVEWSGARSPRGPAPVRPRGRLDTGSTDLSSAHGRPSRLFRPPPGRVRRAHGRARGRARRQAPPRGVAASSEPSRRGLRAALRPPAVACSPANRERACRRNP